MVDEIAVWDPVCEAVSRSTGHVYVAVVYA